MQSSLRTKMWFMYDSVWFPILSLWNESALNELTDPLHNQDSISRWLYGMEREVVRKGRVSEHPPQRRQGGLPILRVAERLKLWANLMSACMWLHFFFLPVSMYCSGVVYHSLSDFNATLMGVTQRVSLFCLKSEVWMSSYLRKDSTQKGVTCVLKVVRSL